MKKYLMMGAAALTMGFAFVSCSSDDDIYINKEQQYKAVFEKEFGKVDPNQTWGFGENATRSANVNRNEWGTGKGVGGHVVVPENVTKNEKDLVYNWFNQERKVWTSTQVNWNSYFISEVWKGEAEYYDWNQYNWTYAKGTDPVRGELKSGATKFLASDKMNHLQVRYGDGSIDANGKLVGAWEHANDFNSGNHNSTYGTIEGHTYMENSGTLEFAYHNTMDSKYHNEYIIVPGETIDPSLAGYYYVGFDFLANDFYVQDDSGAPQHLNMCADRDWYYTDWIVRISPGEFIGQKRIYVEDLIASDLQTVDKSDWDFNDAVFDAFINYNQYDINGSYAIITLRAAGGTLPLTIAGREVHELFGVSQSTMVNTGVGADVPPVQFRIPGNQLTSGDANDIEVSVTNAEGKKIVLTANQGEATQKFAVPAGEHVKWMKERQHISTGYENFSQYVKNASIVEWWNPAVETPLFQKYY